MNEIQIFNNPEFGSVRTSNINGEPWFVGKDVCEAFGDTNYRRSLSNIDDSDKGVAQIETPGGKQNMVIINESGLYSLLFQMQPQKAKGVSQNESIIDERIEKLHRFKRWVTSEVLPSIRKNGGYIANQEQMTPEQIVANALIVAQNIISQKDRQIEELETSVQQMDSVITEMTPKVDYADHILSSTDCMTVSQIAQDYGMSAKRFNKILHTAGIQRKVGDQWILYAEYQGKGYVRNKTCEYTKGNGDTGTKLLTVWTQKGRMLIYEKLKQIGVFPEMENAS